MRRSLLPVMPTSGIWICFPSSDADVAERRQGTDGAARIVDANMESLRSAAVGNQRQLGSCHSVRSNPRRDAGDLSGPVSWCIALAGA